MSVFILQIIAMTSMLCDHLAIVLFENHIALRLIGRFAFIIYAFLLAEGFRHFKDDKKRVLCHLRSYIILALISEPCYDFFLHPNFDADKAMTSQSVMMTLLVGFLCLIAINAWQGKILYQISAVLLGASFDFLMFADYKFTGVFLICALYLYALNFLDKSYFKRLFCLICIFMFYLPLYHWIRYDFCSFDIYVSKLNFSNILLYATHIFIAIFLADYNGKLGNYSKKFKMLYKSFYPLHLFALGLLRKFLGA